MSRSFTPPDTLSKEEVRTIADVRRDIWSSAFTGMGVGAVSGVGLHSIASMASRRGLVKGMNLNRNTAVFAFLAGGAMGSFLMATTTGKNEVHKLHPIFEVGSLKEKEQELEKEYEQSLVRAQKRGSELRTMEHDRLTRRVVHDKKGTNAYTSTFVDTEKERKLREQNRILRRQTLQETLEHGHGLSDSHGGTWAEDETEAERKMREKNRVLRRQTLQETIEHGHGLSDSHGGKWASEDEQRR